MFFKNLIIRILLVSFLSGCAQNAALLGPVYTLATTGNVYQASFAYGSNEIITKTTGKSPTENIKSLIDSKKIKVEEKESQEEFFALVKSRIEKTSKIIQLANQ